MASINMFHADILRGPTEEGGKGENGESESEEVILLVVLLCLSTLLQLYISI
jgi:hypothetical protein